MPRHKRRQRGRVTIQPQIAAEFGVQVPPQDNVRYLSPNEIGKILDVTGEAVKQWIYQRKLPAVKLVNGYWRVKVTDLEQFLKGKTGLIKHNILTSVQSPEIQQSIAELGYTESVSSSSYDLVLQAVNQQPALIILGDHQNGGGNNFSSETINSIKLIRKQKSLRRVPILVTTCAQLQDQDIEFAVDHGVGGIITPITGILDKESIKRNIQRAVERT